MIRKIENLVDDATNERLYDEDWERNLDIVDLISRSPDEAAPTVISVIVKRFQFPNSQSQILSLTLLDTCIKNCGRFFVDKLEQSTFLPTAEKLLSKGELESDAKEKFLSSLQDWATSLHHNPKFFETYDRLRTQGYEFPNSDNNNNNNNNEPNSLIDTDVRESGNNSNQKISKFDKIRQDLNSVSETASLLEQLTQESNNSQELKNNDSASQLYANSKEMQTRLMQLVESISDENLLMDILSANDKINSTVNGYKHFIKYGEKPSPSVNNNNNQNNNQNKNTQQNNDEDLFIFDNNNQNNQNNNNNNNNNNNTESGSKDTYSLDDLLSNLPEPAGSSSSNRNDNHNVSGGSGNTTKPVSNQNAPAIPSSDDIFDSQFDALASSTNDKYTQSSPSQSSSQQQQQPSGLYPSVQSYNNNNNASNNAPSAPNPFQINTSNVPNTNNNNNNNNSQYDEYDDEFDQIAASTSARGNKNQRDEFDEFLDNHVSNTNPNSLNEKKKKQMENEYDNLFEL